MALALPFWEKLGAADGAEGLESAEQERPARAEGREPRPRSGPVPRESLGQLEARGLPLHPSHRMCSKGIGAWCSTCGAATQSTKCSALKRFCGAPTPGGKQALARVKRGRPLRHGAERGEHGEGLAWFAAWRANVSACEQGYAPWGWPP